MTFYLPNSSSLWGKLNYIREKVTELRTMLMSLFNSAEGLEFLLSSEWQLALPEPKKQEV